MLGTGLCQLRLHGRRHLVVVTVQPAFCRLEHRGIGLASLERSEFRLARHAQFAGVTGHDLVAVGNDGFKGLLVCHRLHVAEGHLGRHLLHGGQPQRLQDADVHPADVEFIGLDRQLGGRGIGVVVVVQLFAADDDAPGRHVGAAVHRLEVAVAPPMADAIDDAGRR